MKLSEELQQLHDCGDVGQAVEGLSEKAKRLEDCVHHLMVKKWLSRGYNYDKAVKFASRDLELLK